MKWHEGLIAGSVIREVTFEKVGRLVQTLKDKRFPDRKGNWVVGYDTRFQADAIAKFCTEILAADQNKVYFAKEPVPYGAILHKLLNEHALGAIYVTGGGNGVEYNGIRFTASDGEELQKDEWQRVEQQMKEAGPLSTVDFSIAVSNRKIEPVSLMDEYVDFLRQVLDVEKLKNSPLTVICDSMYGSAQGIIQQLFLTEKRNFEEIHLARHSMFGGLCPNPVRAQLSELFSALEHTKKHLGIAWDAEGRRWAWTNRTTGNLLPGDKLYHQIRDYVQHKNKELSPLLIKKDGILSALLFLQMLVDEA